MDVEPASKKIDELSQDLKDRCKQVFIFNGLGGGPRSRGKTQAEEVQLILDFLESDGVPDSVATLRSQLVEVYQADVAYDISTVLRQVLDAYYTPKADMRNWSLRYGAQKSAVQQSWQMDYKGDAVDRFLQILHGYQTSALIGDSTAAIYACFFPIINSSGTGKSRLMSEVGARTLSVPICLRESSSTGYPPCDTELYAFFKANIPHESFDRCKAFFSCYLRAIFEQLILRAATKRELEPLKFWEEMQHLGPLYEEHQPTRKLFHAAVSLETMQHFKKLPVAEVITSEILAEHVKETRRTFEKLIEIMDELSPENSHQPLLLVIDEAHHLHFPVDALEPKTKTQRFADTALRSVMSDFGSLNQLPIHRFFVILLSTTGQARQFYPRPENDSSMRNHTLENRLLPPYVSMGFEPMRPVNYYESLMGQNVTVLGDVTTFWPFTRPLFASFWLNLTSKDPDALAEIVYLKLLLEPDRLRRRLAAKRAIDPQSFSLFAIRLPLKLPSSDPDYNEAGEKMVESYLRICRGVDRFNNLKTEAPVDSLLAAISAYTMNSEISAAQHLSRHLESSKADEGQRGEIVGMFMLLCAHDHCNRSLRTVPNFSFAKPVTLNRFFFAITNGQSTNVHLPQGFVHFTHFWQLPDVVPSGKEELSVSLFNMFCRGTALACTHNQEAIDALIPMCYGTKLSPENMGAILVQFKNRVTFGRPSQFDAFKRMAKWRRASCDLQADSESRPGIDILFTLGTKEAAPMWGWPITKSAASSKHDLVEEATQRLTINGLSSLMHLGDLNEKLCDELLCNGTDPVDDFASNIPDPFLARLTLQEGLDGNKALAERNATMPGSRTGHCVGSTHSQPQEMDQT